MKRYQLVLIPVLALFLFFGHHRHKKACACDTLAFTPSVIYQPQVAVAAYPVYASTFAIAQPFAVVSSGSAVQVNVASGQRVRVHTGLFGNTRVLVHR